MGTLAFLLDIFVEVIIEWRWHVTEKVVQTQGWGYGLLTIIGISLPLALIAMLLTAFVAPATTGSGVAETMGILNGVNYPDFITFKCLVVKFLGVAFAVSAGLCVGKEGPLVHMGSIVGCAMPYIPLKFARYFRNDFEKRKLMVNLEEN
jgi:H+/Cl- antiporter ClcA